jgi:phospholipid/cholesterol/gamma-HCH transport system substrate-binding protein
MSHNAIETVLGGVVVIVAGMFVSFAYETAQVKVVKGNELCANFLKIGGLDKGSDVRVNGIKVGTVTSLHLDTKTYDAVTCMNIQANLKLPVDSEAAIGSEGVLGGKYVRLTPGVKKTFIPARLRTRWGRSSSWPPAAMKRSKVAVVVGSRPRFAVN